MLYALFGMGLAIYISVVSIWDYLAVTSQVVMAKSL